eukprot:augustus_masked-scaffold_31-processed-gene-1.13-mRNA-1 protein AED:0.00 eAED:0.00 QI:469/1/1/1/1/1/2/151/274
MKKIAKDVYTHGHAASVLRQHGARTVENYAQQTIPYLVPGATVLDVGCGPGSITKGFSDRVGSSGKVIGFDYSPDVIKVASQNFQNENLTFEVQDIYNISFESESFDIVHAHQVLQHLSNPVLGLKEMYRVCKKEGIVTVRDSDYATMQSFPEMEEIETWRKIYMKTCKLNKAEPRAGIFLPSWCREAGIPEEEVEYNLIPQLMKESVNGDVREKYAFDWSERILKSSFAKQAIEYGLADQAELERLSEGWKKFAERKDGIYIYVHGEIIVKKK